MNPIEVQKALDKQIAKKPYIWGYGFDEVGNIIYDMWDCPECEKSYELEYDEYKYCPECGQRLDWSDEE